MNHIQWLCFSPARISASACSYTPPLCASTKRCRLKGSAFDIPQLNPKAAPEVANIIRGPLPLPARSPSPPPHPKEPHGSLQYRRLVPPDVRRVAPVGRCRDRDRASILADHGRRACSPPRSTADAEREARRGDRACRGAGGRAHPKPRGGRAQGDERLWPKGSRQPQAAWLTASGENGTPRDQNSMVT